MRKSAPKKKRNFRRVNGPKTFRAWNDWEVGETLSGKIVAVTPDKKYKDRKNYHVEIEELNFDFEKQNGEILDVGEIIVLNDCGSLDKGLPKNCKGLFIEVEYDGMSEVTSGEWEGTEAHSVILSIDEGEEDEAGPLDEEDEEEVDL